MCHKDDLFHRVYYGLHISMSFIMAISIEHPDHYFFDFRYAASFFSFCSVIIRLLNVGVWVHFLQNDRALRENQNSRLLPKYTRQAVVQQVSRHIWCILVSSVLIAITVMLKYNGNPGAKADLNAYHDDTSEEIRGHNRLTVFLWLAAIAVEQTGSTYAIIYDKVRSCSEKLKKTFTRN